MTDRGREKIARQPGALEQPGLAALPPHRMAPGHEGTGLQEHYLDIGFMLLALMPFLFLLGGGHRRFVTPARAATESVAEP